MKAVFFDRDGVINVDVAYLHKIEEFQWIDGSQETLAYLTELGYKIFIVTNHTFSKKIAILFIIALVLDIILIFTDNVRFYTYRMDHPTVYRYLAAACGYSLRPAIIYFLTLF